MRKLLLITGLFTVMSLSVGHAQLGDIAFTLANHDGADDFTIVLLRDFTSGEQIEFTDNGWFAAGGFRANEGTMLFTFGGNYLAGSQITLFADESSQPIDQTGANAGTSVETGGMSLSATGDVIFAYDPSNVPSAGNESGFMAAIHMNGAWDADATSSTSSAKPAVFTDGDTSIAIDPEADNARFNNCVAASGAADAAALRVIINTLANWESNQSTAYTSNPPLCDFLTVLSVDSPQLRASLDTYPNPTEGEFFIRNRGSENLLDANLYDISGRLVRSFNLVEVPQSEASLDFSGLRKGLYILKINAEKASISQRVVLK